MEILSPEPPKQLNISLSDSGDDSDFDTMRNKCEFSRFISYRTILYDTLGPDMSHKLSYMLIF